MTVSVYGGALYTMRERNPHISSVALLHDASWQAKVNTWHTFAYVPAEFVPTLHALLYGGPASATDDLRFAELDTDHVHVGPGRAVGAFPPRDKLPLRYRKAFAGGAYTQGHSAGKYGLVGFPLPRMTNPASVTERKRNDAACSRVNADGEVIHVAAQDNAE